MSKKSQENRPKNSIAQHVKEKQKKIQKIVNLPNAMSLFRIFAVPWFIYFLLSPDPFWQWLAVILFLLASVTDYIDGYWARKYGMETNIGRHLDSLADKILVMGALLTFVSVSAQIELWMVMCILSRDLIITFLRYLAYLNGTYLRTTQFAKVKTAFQMLSITLILISFLLLTYRERKLIDQIYLDQPEESTFSIAFDNLQMFVGNISSGNIIFQLATFIPYYLLFFTALVTIISGAQYLYINRSLFVVRRK